MQAIADAKLGKSSVRAQAVIDDMDKKEAQAKAEAKAKRIAEEKRVAEEKAIAEAARVEAERVAAEQAAQEAARIAEIARQAQLAKERAYVAPSPQYATNTAYSGSIADWLLKLRTCESGGNYSINTGNGYYGAYQFSYATWAHWNTGYERADLAPPEVQDAIIIKNTNATSGIRTQNPGCMAKMGLSNYPPAS